MMTMNDNNKKLPPCLDPNYLASHTIRPDKSDKLDNRKGKPAEKENQGK